MDPTRSSARCAARSDECAPVRCGAVRSSQRQLCRPLSVLLCRLHRSRQNTLPRLIAPQPGSPAGSRSPRQSLQTNDDVCPDPGIGCEATNRPHEFQRILHCHRTDASGEGQWGSRWNDRSKRKGAPGSARDDRKRGQGASRRVAGTRGERKLRVQRPRVREVVTPTASDRRGLCHRRSSSLTIQFPNAPFNQLACFIHDVGGAAGRTNEPRKLGMAQNEQRRSQPDATFNDSTGPACNLVLTPCPGSAGDACGRSTGLMGGRTFGGRWANGRRWTHLRRSRAVGHRYPVLCRNLPDRASFGRASSRSSGASADSKPTATTCGAHLRKIGRRCRRSFFAASDKTAGIDDRSIGFPVGYINSSSHPH